MAMCLLWQALGGSIGLWLAHNAALQWP